MNIGKRLRDLRSSNNLTITQLAEELSVDRSTIGKYESNMRTPDAKMLCVLADYFDVSVDFLFDRKGF